MACELGVGCEPGGVAGVGLRYVGGNENGWIETPVSPGNSIVLAKDPGFIPGFMTGGLDMTIASNWDGSCGGGGRTEATGSEFSASVSPAPSPSEIGVVEVVMGGGFLWACA